jgi:hypothetical protein
MLGGGGVLPRAENSAAQQEADFMYLRAILCTFQISVDFYYVLYLRAGLFWAQMALATLFSISGPKKVSILRSPPPPLKWPLLWICLPQNHFVPHHINNRYINS